MRWKSETYDVIKNFCAPGEIFSLLDLYKCEYYFRNLYYIMLSVCYHW